MLSAAPLQGYITLFYRMVGRRGIVGNGDRLTWQRGQVAESGAVSAAGKLSRRKHKRQALGGGPRTSAQHDGAACAGERRSGNPEARAGADH
ncbi:MAG: hypothetical protein ABRQ23_00245 [Syntrophomonadaceae bacterium]